jgi:hypothetical protein
MWWGRQFGGPRIAGGDFNAWWGEWWIRRMTEEHTDTWVDVRGTVEGGYTLNGAVRFDYLFRAHTDNWRVMPSAARRPSPAWHLAGSGHVHRVLQPFSGADPAHGEAPPTGSPRCRRRWRDRLPRCCPVCDRGRPRPDRPRRNPLPPRSPAARAACRRTASIAAGTTEQPGAATTTRRGTICPWSRVSRWIRGAHPAGARHHRRITRLTTSGDHRPGAGELGGRRRTSRRQGL